MNRWLCVIMVSVRIAISLLARSAGTPSGRGTNRVSWIPAVSPMLIRIGSPARSTIAGI
jgi:hypothetical protein